MLKMIVTELVSKTGDVIAVVGNRHEVWARIEARGLYIELQTIYDDQIKNVKFLNDPPFFMILGDHREIDWPPEVAKEITPTPKPSGEVHVKLDNNP